MTYERAHIERMRGYIPGIQPRTDAIKLNTNENPFPPSPMVMARLADIPVRTLQRYPDPLAEEFRLAAAHRHGLPPAQGVAPHGATRKPMECGPGAARHRDESSRAIWNAGANRSDRAPRHVVPGGVAGRRGLCGLCRSGPGP